MKPDHIKLIQVLGELLIPLLGYFFWNWNFYFIGLFYFLDLLANTVLLFFKLKKITGFEKLKSKIILHFVLYFLSLGVLFILGVLLTKQIIPNFDLEKQSIDFIMLKDMGLPQGIFLLPLVAYAAYMQYKMEFLMPKKYLHVSADSLLKKHFMGMVICIGLLGLSFGISTFIVIPEMVAVLVMIVLTAAYSYWMRRA